MSRRAVVAVLVVMLVVAGGAVWWVTRPRPAATPAACSIPDSVASVASASAASTSDGGSASGGAGGVTVMDQGFSVQRRTADSSSLGVSIGAVVRNTGSKVAYRTRITFRVKDSEHHDAARPNSLQLVQEIPVLLPGEWIGVGAFTYVTRTLPALSVEVVPSGTRWLDPAVLGAYKPVVTAYAGTSGIGPPTITMTVDSANCRPLDSRGGAVVYRNALGIIVGGDEAPLRSEGDQVCKRGKVTAFLDATADAPANRSDAKTTTYAYCDLEPKPFGVDIPWN